MNDAQWVALSTLPRVSGTLSMFGSGYVSYEILSSRQKLRDVQQRILLGLALTDAVTSFHYVLGNLPFPVADGGAGNVATCNASGFVGQFVTSTAIYHAGLGLYYLLTIKYGWRGKRLKNMELGCHILAISFAIVTGVICIHYEVFNPGMIYATQKGTGY